MIRSAGFGAKTKIMNPYQQIFSTATGVIDETDLNEIEDYVRNVIFESSLSNKTKAQLVKAARNAWHDIQFMRTPEGQAYVAKLEVQMLGH